MMTEKPILKLMAEYGCDPLWIDVNPYNVNRLDLPISPDLRNALNTWAKDFEETYNPNDPRESEFSTLESRATFEAQGRTLLNRLKTELGCYFEIILRINT